METRGVFTCHYGTKPGHFETSKIHFPTSEGVSERTSEWPSTYVSIHGCSVPLCIAGVVERPSDRQSDGSRVEGVLLEDEGRLLSLPGRSRASGRRQIQ